MKRAIILLFVFILMNCSSGEDENPLFSSAPNIVFILADDASWKHFGVYGCNAVNTPNIDKMAAEGVLFIININKV